MSRKFLPELSALVLALVLGRGLAAQVGAPPAQTVPFEEALNYALQHYPAVRTSLEQAAAARAAVPLARTQYPPYLSGVYRDGRATQNQVAGIWLPTSITPTVEGPVGASFSGQSYWNNQTAALFSREPIDVGLRAAVVGEAKSAADKSIADLALTKLEVATAVGAYFLSVLARHQAVVAAPLFTTDDKEDAAR